LLLVLCHALTKQLLLLLLPLPFTFSTAHGTVSIILIVVAFTNVSPAFKSLFWLVVLLGHLTVPQSNLTQLVQDLVVILLHLSLTDHHHH
jgi:hypothetical protein